MGSTGDLSLKWNPKNLEIKTRTVERTLEPLVMQVCLNGFTFHHDILPGTIQKDSLSKKNCHVYIFLWCFTKTSVSGDDLGFLKVSSEEGC